MKPQWMTGAGIKERFGPKGDIRDDVFYPIDGEGNVNWDLVNRIRDTQNIPTYDDILKELDVPQKVILSFRGFGPSYSSLLHIYALKRGKDIGELMKLISLQAEKPKEEEIGSSPDKEE